MSNLKRLASVSLIVLALVAATLPAHASLTLNATGIADGFTLSTFVSGYSFGTYGPLSQAVLPNGNIITGSAGNSTLYVFADVDNQHLSDALISTPYTFQTGNPHWAFTNAGGQVYGAQLFGGVFEHFANDATFTPMTGAVSTLRG